MVLWTFFVIAGTGENWKGVPKYQRGSTKAWKRGTFEMWIEYGRPSWQQLSSVTRFRDDNTWAWKVPVGAHTSNFARRRPYFSPLFSHISPPTDLICVILIWIIYISIKISLQQKWGKTEQYLARYPNLAHFPLRKSAKGVPKRWKANRHQVYSFKPWMI